MTSAQLPLIAAGTVACVALWLLTVRRPALGFCLLVLAIPLTAGMPRGSIVPLLRVNEVLLVVVAAGLVVHGLPRRRRLVFSGLDLAVLSFCLGGVLIPTAVILLESSSADMDAWLQVVAPIQYLLVYLVFSRLPLTQTELRWLINLTLLSSVIVAIVAVAELADLPGVRSVIANYYPPPPAATVQVGTVYRPTSLLGHFSAVGGFAVLNLTLALALAAARVPGFSGLWLGFVMALNGVALLATATVAPLIALPVMVLIVLAYTRHVPWQLSFAPPALVGAVVVFWSSVQGRIQEQLVVGSGPALPESMQVRLRYWQDYFVPALVNHGAWFGTGTLIPSEVPRPLVGFVDNGYLWMAFRAGVPGILLLLLILVALSAAGWSLRTSRQPWHRALGATSVAFVVGFALLELTSEYLTFTSVTQEFWMVAGLLAAVVPERAPAPPELDEVRPSTSGALPQRQLPAG